MWMLQITGGINVDNAETIIAKLKLDGSKAEFVRSDIKPLSNFTMKQRLIEDLKMELTKHFLMVGAMQLILQM